MINRAKSWQLRVTDFKTDRECYSPVLPTYEDASMWAGFIITGCLGYCAEIVETDWNRYARNGNELEEVA